MKVYIHITDTPADQWLELDNNKDLMLFIKEADIKKFDYRQGYKFNSFWIKEIE
jgi:hypothetical protein